MVDCPGAQGTYTYRVPSTIAVAPGDIVSVPFGPQQVGGLVLHRQATLPHALAPSTVREIDELVCQGFFPPGYWAVLQQVATYYCTPLMQVVRTALPPGLLGRSQRRLRLTPSGKTPEAGAIAVLSPAALRVWQLLHRSKTQDYTWQYAQRQVPRAAAGIHDLVQLGWVERYLEPPRAIRPKQRQAVIMAAIADDIAVSDRQREVLEVLRRRGGEVWMQELLQICRISSSVVQALARKGYVVIQPREVLRLESSPMAAGDRPKALTPAQAEAVTAIATAVADQTLLLHGVTGSGKTEVYLQAIAPVLQGGRSALVLVPEIGLTPQLTDRFRARFGDRVRVYHSALSEGERYDTWRLMLDGRPQVVIGTRSAIFAPLANLGLIVLDEEHDTSFKQDQPAPTYHARQVAQWRAAAANCPLVLGSATPAIDTWALLAEPPTPHLADAPLDTPTDARIENVDPLIHPQEANPLAPNCSDLLGSKLISAPSAGLSAASRTIHYLSLPERVEARSLPQIQVVDMRRELQQGHRSIFSRSLQAALDQLQQRRERGILFIHRRGHSTFVSCRDCGHVVMCPHCDISLTYHQTHAEGTPSLRCHYCGHWQSHPEQCPACDSTYFKHFGSGTQRVMHELERDFPHLRCLRFDSDTTRHKGAHRALLDRFANGDADVLVGTQMLTKGLDLPDVTLVGIVAADGLLYLSDYRASERAFQTLLQVAGRAGRGDRPGQVLLQTYAPEHPVVQAVVQHQYEPFAAQELQYRVELDYPPFSRMAVVRLSGPQPDVVRQTALTLRDRLEAWLPDCTLLGPAPAAIARVSGRYRWQILLKRSLDSPPQWPLSLERMRSLCPATVSLSLDIDPLTLL
ncbi:MAG: primosomal protein N' [Kaiparowitsia implicata GSE-PSE-MK54-09C]|jgi:primosomal protein N' (replication factor Y)|nr:primosomal protein N' [Kaiparowitsia implicata GSE-PSE-MK54-09C]